MKKICLVFAIALLGSSAFAGGGSSKLVGVKLNKAIAGVVVDCNTLLASIDLIACPTIQQFEFTGTLADAQKALDAEMGIMPKKATLKKAKELILTSVLKQTQTYFDYLKSIGATSNLREIDVSGRLGAYGFAMEAYGNQGYSPFIDTTTYWAPSVDAVASVFMKQVNNKVSIIVFMHGNTDG